MKRRNIRANAKIVILVEVILILTICIMLYFLEKDRSIIGAIFLVSGLIIIIPTVFCGVIGSRDKKDFLFYAGALLFFGAFGCFLSERISAKLMLLLIITSFAIECFPLIAKAISNRDKRS